METRLMEIVAEVIAEKGASLIDLETTADQVYGLVEFDPQFGMHPLVKAIKGRSSPATPGVRMAALPVAHVMDDLVLRDSRWRGEVVGDQPLCAKPKESVTDAGG
jgi:hypothetical protein